MKQIITVIVILVSLTSLAEARPRAWCGWWLAQHLGFNDRSLWLARNWARKFPRVAPAPGMVAVYARGRGGHVGKILAVHQGSITMISGNDGGAVRTRVRSTKGMIAVVNPYQWGRSLPSGKRHKVPHPGSLVDGFSRDHS